MVVVDCGLLPVERVENTECERSAGCKFRDGVTLRPSLWRACLYSIDNANCRRWVDVIDESGSPRAERFRCRKEGIFDQVVAVEGRSVTEGCGAGTARRPRLGTGVSAAPVRAAERWRQRMRGFSIRNQLVQASPNTIASRSSSVGQNDQCVPSAPGCSAKKTGKWMR